MILSNILVVRHFGIIAIAAITVLAPRSGVISGSSHGVVSGKKVKLGAGTSAWSKSSSTSTRIHGVSTIPIRMTESASSVSSGGALNCTVTVEFVPPGGGYAQVMCDTPGAFTSPDGNWPTNIYFPPGSSTTANFTLTANSVSSSTAVNLYFGTSEDDPSNLSEWGYGGAVTVVPD